MSLVWLEDVTLTSSAACWELRSHAAQRLRDQEHRGGPAVARERQDRGCSGIGGAGVPGGAGAGEVRAGCGDPGHQPGFHEGRGTPTSPQVV